MRRSDALRQTRTCNRRGQCFDARGLMPDRSVRGAATDSARALLRRLIEQHGPVLLLLRSGAATPICLPAREFHPDDGDVLVTRLPWHTEFWMSDDNYARFAGDHLTVDVRPEADDDAPTGSLEAAEQSSFVLSVRPLDATEAAAAAAAPPPRTGADRLR
ncbi:DUF779 domain-containing protein [Nocardia cyriacigeorgica]|uniref:DUF779 domain-containing protein n=1 Tax=Nocardia cyriacigeorgica TaxID=135487 RepID=A0A6P1D6B5_9NOCA|nr:DUF779 domain-containing protein [Nocardia cyriacigeorgica]NEW44924.1 DUF779 domain-containing protein [Nocardia cyriacigeorgica]NEW49165.1 DUF779 domain-containing protein [Nocardia cyriacigeorgica]